LAKVGVGGVGGDERKRAREPELFSGFGKVPAGFGVGILMNLICFLAAAIANHHQVIGVGEEAAKDDGAVGGCAIRFYGGQLKVAGEGLRAIAVQGSRKGWSPGC
jgi:hypothetical protein